MICCRDLSVFTLSSFVILYGTIVNSEISKLKVGSAKYLSADSIENNFAFHDDSLKNEICDCGSQSTSCSIVGNETLACVCKPRHAQTNTSLTGICAECDCGENGTCGFKENVKKCNCRDGFYEVSGSCEILTGCGCDENEECKFIDGEKKCYCKDGFAAFLGQCIECDCGLNATSCSYNLLFKIRLCDCADGYASKKTSLVNLNEYCEECDCGKNGTCEFSNGAKDCSCFDGFKELYGKCQECDCGPNSISCELDDAKVNRCVCKEGYSPKHSKENKNEYCEKCDCGQYGKCEFIDQTKKCSCDSSYFEVRGKCQECDCGPNSVFCRKGLVNSKLCTCKDGYLPAQETESGDYYCKECNCGSGSLSCDFTLSGERRCNCSSGYHLRKERNNEYCHYIYVYQEDGSVSGWQIAVYVLSTFIAIMMIASLIAIADKQRSKRKSQIV